MRVQLSWVCCKRMFLCQSVPGLREVTSTSWLWQDDQLAILSIHRSDVDVLQVILAKESYIVWIVWSGSAQFWACRVSVKMTMLSSIHSWRWSELHSQSPVLNWNCSATASIPCCTFSVVCVSSNRRRPVFTISVGITVCRPYCQDGPLHLSAAVPYFLCPTLT